MNRMIQMPAPTTPSDLAREPQVRPIPSTHLQVTDLVIRRGDRHLVDGLNLTVPRGSVVAITGPSGIGKTSFLECLAGTLAPQSGTIRFTDVRGQESPPGEFRERVGVIFQEFLLIPGCSTEVNVLCGALGRHPWWRTLLGFPAHEKTHARHWLKQVHLEGALNRPVSLLSGGEQQRVAIARALLQNPEVILADEPVSNLDATLAWEMMAMLRTVCREEGRTLICVLHDLRLVEAFADLHVTFPPSNPINRDAQEHHAHCTAPCCTQSVTV